MNLVYVTNRFLTYSYLSSFNARLLLSPIILSYDWQMGSIELITSISDTRNIWALILVIALGAIIWKIYRHSTSSRVEVSQNNKYLNKTHQTFHFYSIPSDCYNFRTDYLLIYQKTYHIYRDKANYLICRICRTVLFVSEQQC